MNKSVKFTIVGKIRGKQRPRITSRGTFTPKETVEYENAVRAAYITQSGKDFADKSVKIAIHAYFAIPQSYTKARKKQAAEGQIKPAKKPDCDNIAKIICDALNGVAYDDDKQVVDMRIVKAYTTGAERVEVEIMEVRNEYEQINIKT